jgi:uncharacterized protein (TIGR04222 family)
MIPALNTLAEIPILDLHGPEFLMVYGSLFVAACVWSVVRVKGALRKHGRPGDAEMLTGPYEMAVLSAGAGRACQLGVVTLMQKNLISWKTGFVNARLVANTMDIPSGLPGIEEDLLRMVQTHGSKGLQVKQVNSLLSNSVRPIEVRLATAGLRPTLEERKSAGFSSTLPLLFLGGFGLIKLVIGISRGKPVMFRVLMLLVTVIAAKWIAPNAGRLTAAGENLLARLRDKHQAAKRAATTSEAEVPDMLFAGAALLGPAVLMSHPAFADVHKDLQSKMGAAVASGDSGRVCSSGCGGGCGGCGGG